MKNILMALMLFAASETIAQQTRSDSILTDFLYHPDRVLVAAHRSAHQNYPENSLAAMREAITLGVDIIELDVRQTKDGRLIILHNVTVDHTTNGKGAVSSYTFDELRKLRLLFKGQVTNEQIPTFEEALQTAKGNIMIDIDFKSDDKAAVAATYRLIKQYHMENQVLFFAYQYKDIPELKKLDSNVKIMPRAYTEADVNEILKYHFIKVIHVDDSFYSDKLMKKIRDAQIRVWSNALGKYDDMEEANKDSGFYELLKKKQINVIQTNLPQQLLTYLRTMGLHK